MLVTQLQLSMDLLPDTDLAASSGQQLIIKCKQPSLPPGNRMAQMHQHLQGTTVSSSATAQSAGSSQHLPCRISCLCALL